RRPSWRRSWPSRLGLEELDHHVFAMLGERLLENGQHALLGRTFTQLARLMHILVRRPAQHPCRVLEFSLWGHGYGRLFMSSSRNTTTIKNDSTAHTTPRPVPSPNISQRIKVMGPVSPPRGLAAASRASRPCRAS